MGTAAFVASAGIVAVTQTTVSAAEDPSTYVLGTGISAELNDVHFNVNGQKVSYTEIACDDAVDGRSATEAVLVTTSAGEYRRSYHLNNRGAGTCDGLDRNTIDSRGVVKIRIQACQQKNGVRTNCVKSPYLINPYYPTAIKKPKK